MVQVGPHISVPKYGKLIKEFLVGKYGLAPNSSLQEAADFLAAKWKLELKDEIVDWKSQQAGSNAIVSTIASGQAFLSDMSV